MTTILLTPRKEKKKQFAPLHPKSVSSTHEIQASLSRAEKDTLWISDDPRILIKLLKNIPWSTKRLGRALLLHKLELSTLAVLRKCFDPVVYSTTGGFLPREELAKALIAKNRKDLIIGGIVDPVSRTITLWRGNLDCLVIPFSAFPSSGDGIVPNFKAFSVTDYGHTIRLGEYEAAVDAILDEFDSNYHRRRKNGR